MPIPIHCPEIPDTYLSQRKLARTPKERRRISKQRLNLLHNRIHKSLSSLLLLLSRSPQDPKELAVDLGEEGVDEEVDACTLESAIRSGGWLEEVGGKGVDEKLGDDGGFGDDFVAVFEGGDEAAGVDCWEV